MKISRTHFVEESGGYRLSMSETISTSSSAAAIFSAEESCGRPPNRKDMVFRKFYGACSNCRRSRLKLTASQVYLRCCSSAVFSVLGGFCKCLVGARPITNNLIFSR